MSDTTLFEVHATEFALDAEDTDAVIINYGQMSIGLSIAQARELGLALQRSADEAEAKLK